MITTIKTITINLCISTVILFTLTLLVTGVAHAIHNGYAFGQTESIHDILELLMASAIVTCIIFVKEFFEGYIKKI